eukprot:6236738-Amphidinium_carterae.1
MADHASFQLRYRREGSMALAFDMFGKMQSSPLGRLTSSQATPYPCCNGFKPVVSEWGPHLEGHPFLLFRLLVAASCIVGKLASFRSEPTSWVAGR